MNRGDDEQNSHAANTRWNTTDRSLLDANNDNDDRENVEDQLLTIEILCQQLRNRQQQDELEQQRQNSPDQHSQNVNAEDAEDTLTQLLAVEALCQQLRNERQEDDQDAQDVVGQHNTPARCLDDNDTGDDGANANNLPRLQPTETAHQQESEPTEQYHCRQDYNSQRDATEQSLYNNANVNDNRNNDNDEVSQLQRIENSSGMFYIIYI